MRVSEPTYTQTPNDLFDHWLPHLGEIELKVLLVIMRKTFGWHKADLRDRISISQLEKLTGSTPSNILKAVNFLVSKGLILKEVLGSIGKQVTYYQLVVNEDSNNSYPCRNERGTPPDSGVTKETTKEKKQQQCIDKKIPPESGGSQIAAVSLTSSFEKSSSPEILDKSEIPKYPEPPYKTTCKPRIYECLKQLAIPEDEKIEISKDYSEDAVKNAIEWAKFNEKDLKKGILPTIKWAAKKGLKIEIKDIQGSEPKKAIDPAPFNRGYWDVISRQIDRLLKIKGIRSYSAWIETQFEKIYFKDCSFLEQAKNMLRKHEILSDSINVLIERCKKDLCSQ